MLPRLSLARAARIGALFCTLGLGALPLACAVDTPEESTENAIDEPVAEAQQAVGTVCTTIRRGLGSSVVEDAFVSSANAAVNYGSAAYVWAGGTPGSVKYGLARFDLGAIPRGSIITSATLKMMLYAGGGSPVNLHRATAAWSEPSVTWSSFNSALDPTVIASFGISPGPVNANVKSTVQAWVTGVYPNNGFALDRALTTNGLLDSSEDATATNRPALDVCYTAPTTFSGNVNGLYRTFAGSQATFGGNLSLDGSNRTTFVARMTIGATIDFGGGVLAPENGVGAGNVVVKFKTDGSHLFSIPINWADVYALGSDSAGNTIMIVSCSYYNPAGCAVGTTILPGHSIVKLDQAGNIAWVQPTKWGSKLWVTPAGDAFVQDFDLYYYAVPQTLKKLDPAGNTIFNITLGYHINAGTLGPKGDLYFTANSYSNPTFAGTPVAGAFLGKLSPTGAEVWGATSGVKSAGVIAVDAWDRPTTIFNETFFDYYLDVDVTLRHVIDRFDAAGVLRSSSVLGSSPANVHVSSATFDPAGSLIVGGSVDSVPTMSFGGADIPLFSCDPAWADYDLCNTPSTYYAYSASDAFLVKYDGDGNHISSTIFGDPAMQGLGNIVVDSQNRLLAIGSFSSSGTPAHFSFPTAGFLDMFLTRYAF